MSIVLGKFSIFLEGVIVPFDLGPGDTVVFVQPGPEVDQPAALAAERAPR